MLQEEVTSQRSSHHEDRWGKAEVLGVGREGVGVGMGGMGASRGGGVFSSLGVLPMLDSVSQDCDLNFVRTQPLPRMPSLFLFMRQECLGRPPGPRAKGPQATV